MNEKGEPEPDMEKAEVLIELFTSVFSGSRFSPVSQVPEPQGGSWGGKVPLTVS